MAALATTAAFDPIVANPGRLSILAALAVEERQDFVNLRRQTSLTDGNLACHARRLAAAGFIDINKMVMNGKPVTQMAITPVGRKALETHARRVLSAISQRRVVMNVSSGSPNDETRIPESMTNA